MSKLPDFPALGTVKFRLVPGFDSYGADSDGNVWKILQGAWVVMEPHNIDKRGRKIYRVFRKHKMMFANGSRLIAAAFLGPTPDGHFIQHRKHHRPEDNSPSNLYFRPEQ